MAPVECMLLLSRVYARQSGCCRPLLHVKGTRAWRNDTRHALGCVLIGSGVKPACAVSYGVLLDLLQEREKRLADAVRRLLIVDSVDTDKADKLFEAADANK